MEAVAAKTVRTQIPARLDRLPWSRSTVGMMGTGGTTTRSTPWPRADTDREIDQIAQALDEQGPTERSKLEERLKARRWGPGRFRAALRGAVDEGRATRDVGDVYSSTSGESSSRSRESH